MSTAFENRIKCLLCEGKEAEKKKCNLNHIHGHLGYKKYLCKFCEFSCHTDDEAMLHKYKRNHVVLHNRNEYKEALSNLIYLNCLHAAEFGLDAVVSDGALNTNFSVLGSVSQRSNSRAGTGTRNAEREKQKGFEDFSAEGRERKACKKKEVAIVGPSSKSGSPSSSQINRFKGGRLLPEEDLERSSKEQRNEPLLLSVLDETGSTTQLSNPSKDGNKQYKGLAKSETYLTPSTMQTRNRISELSDSYKELPVFSKTNTILQSVEAETLKCRKCNKEISASYVCRKEHILKEHLSVEKQSFSESGVCAEMRVCFPVCTVYSDEQCIECGKFVKSEHGRKTHVSSHHFRRKIECVVPGCGLFEANPSDLKKHIESVHGVPLSSAVSGDTFRLFSCAKKEYDASLAVQLIKYFPFDLPGRNASCNINEIASARGISSQSSRELISTVSSAMCEKTSSHNVQTFHSQRESSSTSGSVEEFFQEISKKTKSNGVGTDTLKNKDTPCYAKETVLSTNDETPHVKRNEKIEHLAKVQEEGCSKKLENGAFANGTDSKNTALTGFRRFSQPLLPTPPSSSRPWLFGAPCSSEAWDQPFHANTFDHFGGNQSYNSQPHFKPFAVDPFFYQQNEASLRYRENDQTSEHEAGSLNKKELRKLLYSKNSRQSKSCKSHSSNPECRRKSQPNSSKLDNEKKIISKNSKRKNQKKNQAQKSKLENQMRSQKKKKPDKKQRQLRKLLLEHAAKTQSEKPLPLFSAPPYRFQGLYQKKANADGEPTAEERKFSETFQKNDDDPNNNLKVDRSATAEVELIYLEDQPKNSITKHPVLLESKQVKHECSDISAKDSADVSSTSLDPAIAKKRESGSISSGWLGKKKHFDSDGPNPEEQKANVKVELSGEVSRDIVENIQIKSC